MLIAWEEYNYFINCTAVQLTIFPKQTKNGGKVYFRRGRLYCESASCELRVCELRVCELRVCEMRACELRVCELRVCELRVCELRVYGGDLLPRKRSLMCNFVWFDELILYFILWQIFSVFILRNALFSLFRIFQILAGKWRHRFGANILFKC